MPSTIEQREVLKRASAQLDSHQRPVGYQPTALLLSYGRIQAWCIIKHQRLFVNKTRFFRDLTFFVKFVSIVCMLKIRLQRVGRKHEPAFKLVLTDSKNSTKSGKAIEVLGNHDFRFEKNTQVKKDRVLYWMSQGAKPSETAHNLLVTLKVIEGKKLNVLPKKTPQAKKEKKK